MKRHALDCDMGVDCSCPILLSATDMPHLVLDDAYRVVWWDTTDHRLEFYDFENDEGFSLSTDECHRLLAWARQLVSGQ